MNDKDAAPGEFTRDGAGMSPPGTKGRLARATLPVVLAAGALLVLLGLRVGFILDDYFHLAILGALDPQATQSPLALWSWAREGERPLLGDAVQGGWLPWWSSPDLRIHFFRPLPSLLHNLDYRLWGLDAWGWRLTTLAVWLTLLWAVVRLYRELAGRSGASPGVVLLAGLLFALDESHAWNTIWLAARHSLVAALFVVVAIGSYLLFRRSGSRRHLVATLIFTALGLLSSEVAVGVVAWVIAYELTLAREGWTARLRAAAPVLSLAALYTVLYIAFEFGSRANGWYVDPVSSPAAFLTRVLPERLPVLIQGLLTPVPPEMGPVFGEWPWAWTAMVLAALVLLAFVPRLRRDPVFRFVALATLLSLFPTALATPINYLLLLPSVGAAWLFASFVGACWDSWKDWRRTREGGRPVFATLAAVFLLLTHAVFAPITFALSAGMLGRTHQRPADHIAGAEAPPGTSRVVVVTAPNRLMAGYLTIAWGQLRTPPRPEGVWVVSPATGPHPFHRTSERSFRLEIPSPGILDSLWDQVIADGAGVAAGSRIRRGAMEVEVLRMEGAGIREIEVTLDRPLDAPDVSLLAWDGKRLVRMRVPGVGGRTVLAPVP